MKKGVAEIIKKISQNTFLDPGIVLQSGIVFSN